MRYFQKKWSDFKVVRYHMRTVFWGPLIAGFAIMFLLAAVPQSREVYLGIIEGREFFKGILGLALIGLLCVLLNSWQHMLGSAAIERIYPEHADIYIDRGLVTQCNWLCRISAYLPLVGLLLGLVKVTFEANIVAKSFSDTLKFFAHDRVDAVFSQFSTTARELPQFYLNTMLMVAAVGVPALLLVLVLRARLSENGRLRQKLRKLAVGAGIFITAATVIFPALAPDYVVGVTQFAGPLAGTAIALIAVVTVLIFLSYLSARLRWPIMGTAVLALLVWMGWQTYSALSPANAHVAQQSLPDLSAAHSERKLYAAFDAWLAARADRQAFDQRDVNYPVFIVAAQGGGIYAAAATSAFLAAIQDDCPGFSQHIFAVSGVSGGAVGASIFNALQGGERGESRIGCGGARTLQQKLRLMEKIKRVVRKDHLSPAIALIWPDVARKAFSELVLDRSKVLERSFACSMPPLDSQFVCPAASGGTGLRMPFDDHWKPTSVAPALVLTATWVETGFRVAFAPFPLHAVSDGTLYSFPGADHEGDFAAQGAQVHPSLSLIEAAFVSARFPGIVSAYQLLAKRPGNVVSLWNFVDGGYVDNSGATTALEIYQKIDEHVRHEALPVSLYLVLLTDAGTDPDIAEVQNGTRFSDTVAPITALLSVRSQLANRAVTRAIDELEPNALAEDLAGRGRGSRVLAVNLKQKAFRLPLGWKISNTTDDIVRLMLGRPDLCDTPMQEDLDQENVRRVIRDNSCVKKRIRELLSGTAQDLPAETAHQ